MTKKYVNFSFMKTPLIFLLLFLSVSISAQIKKKDLGTYTGIIEAYKLNNGVKLIMVKQSDVRVSIDKTILTLQIGQQEYKSEYEVSKESKRVYRITSNLEYSDIQESFVLTNDIVIFLASSFLNFKMRFSCSRALMASCRCARTALLFILIFKKERKMHIRIIRQTTPILGKI